MEFASISALGSSGVGAATAGGLVPLFSVIEFAGGVSTYRGHNW